ncbi:unnamed protein product [Zymoseptoria tritici ST99CH_1A5]|uniref:60s ribosomal protein l38 n=5 Tax=Zymoseptoria TaxID=1047167 RepID=A0A0F4G9L7_9PEZI|nr:60S ribosomal protein L38 [Zymoseptoria tritici IPO323]KJX93712.1 60s ribosomal protein l38 [Zymoseptoria brevis]SMQ52263.1 unnamed protein product [Zymoseptoria tritici ST99CH_3D7]SMR55087.1 unnamed protein product [Zymoseptoria tritici ST99CH_1E4]SMR57471.1 unnamed protein product [Zymoseptoria tritici ST99CH_3D1]SMY25909.1 unnamed protein product [Zymoseptoria tritici ST99CH_1A5]
MPQEVTDIKSFIEICRRKDASSARIKKNKVTGQTKFKVRCNRFLYTLKVQNSEKADKLKQSLPPTLNISDTPKKNAKGKRVAQSS